MTDSSQQGPPRPSTPASERASRYAWWAALGIVSVAALATTGWSLYAVAHHYGAPKFVGAAAVAVFDGAAYACLHLASRAATDGRSAAAARLAALAMAGVSVYLNRFHAQLVHGGLPATLFFAAPTIALLLVSELAWAGPRATVRAARGERPFRLPAFGGWAWLLAPKRAGTAVKSRAVEHIATAGQAQPAAAPHHSATAVLRTKFAAMDPVEVIRIAHESQPQMPPAELAALLVSYGVTVDAVQVALVLHQRRPQDPEVTLERTDDDAHHDAPQVSPARAEVPAIPKAVAIVEAASQLGRDATAAEIVTRVHELHRLDVRENYVRTVLSREAKKAEQKAGGQGGGGYL